ncbi:MAG: hypothetical protein ACO1OA_12110 [Paracoccus marcusii]
MIDIQNLTRIYDGRGAVDDVSLTVEPGQIAALVGTSRVSCLSNPRPGAC